MVALVATAVPVATGSLIPAGAAVASPGYAPVTVAAAEFAPEDAQRQLITQLFGEPIPAASASSTTTTTDDAQPVAATPVAQRPIGGLPDYPAHVFPSAEAGAIIGGLTGGAIGGVAGTAFGLGLGCVAGLPFLIVGCPVGAILGATIGFAVGTTVGAVSGVVLGTSDGIARQLPPPTTTDSATAPTAAQAIPDTQTALPSTTDFPAPEADVIETGIQQIQAGLQQAAHAIGIPQPAAG
ncbi:hypothetical protein GCM10023319_52570 [Nocardia iowensis]